MTHSFPPRRSSDLVYADEVERLHDQVEVLRRELRPRVAEDLLELRRIAAEQGGVQVVLVHVGMRALDRGGIVARIGCGVLRLDVHHQRSEEHTSELQSLMRISYAVFCLNKKRKTTHATIITHNKQ